MKLMTKPTEVEYKTDPRGQLCYPDLHDGAVIGLLLGEQDSCCILVQTVHGVGYKLELTHTIRLRATDFQNGNIILDIVVHDAAKCTEATLASLYEIDIGRDRDHEFLAKLVNRVHAGKLKYVEINPSIGCEFSALCEEFAVYTRPL